MKEECNEFRLHQSVPFDELLHMNLFCYLIDYNHSQSRTIHLDLAFNLYHLPFMDMAIPFFYVNLMALLLANAI